MIAVAVTTLCVWTWIIFSYIAMRINYLEMLKYVSVGGPDAPMMFAMGLMGGPTFVIAAASLSNFENVKSGFRLSPKSPNPIKASYVRGLGQDKIFEENLAKWDRMRKFLLITKWDKVEDERRNLYSQSQIINRKEW